MLALDRCCLWQVLKSQRRQDQHHCIHEVHGEVLPTGEILLLTLRGNLQGQNCPRMNLRDAIALQ